MRWYRSIKMTLGFGLAILIANVFNLDFSLSAGIIAVLNLLDTKKDSAKVAWRRLYASAIGLFIAGLVIYILGKEEWVIIVAVAIFIPIAFKINAREGIAVHIVLASHLIQYDSLTVLHLFNEYLLVIIGAVVALTLNLHMPNKEKILIDMRKEVEDMMRKLISNLGCSIEIMCILNEDEDDLEAIEGKIKKGKSLAYDFMKNHYWKDNREYIEYFQMRLQQIRRLKYLKSRIEQVIFNQNEVYIISEFLIKLAKVFDFENDGIALLAEIKNRKITMDTLPLPKTHYELKQRSALIEFLNDLEEFIAIKARYSLKK